MERLRTLRSEMGLSGEIKGALQHFTAFEEADDFLSTIRSYADAGCTNYGAVWSYPPDEMLQRIKWFAREVMPNAPV